MYQTKSKGFKEIIGSRMLNSHSFNQKAFSKYSKNAVLVKILCALMIALASIAIMIIYVDPKGDLSNLNLLEASLIPTYSIALLYFALNLRNLNLDQEVEMSKYNEIWTIITIHPPAMEYIKQVMNTRGNITHRDLLYVGYFRLSMIKEFLTEHPIRVEDAIIRNSFKEKINKY